MIRALDKRITLLEKVIVPLQRVDIFLRNSADRDIEVISALGRSVLYKREMLGAEEHRAEAADDIRHLLGAKVVLLCDLLFVAYKLNFYVINEWSFLCLFCYKKMLPKTSNEIEKQK